MQKMVLRSLQLATSAFCLSSVALAKSGQTSSALPPELKRIRAMSIDTVERATAKLRLQLQHDRAMSLHKPDVTIKLRIFEETAKALRTTPLLYQTTRTGDCAPQTVPGYGVVSPAANQFRGRVTVCPHTPQEFSDTTSMMTMLIHEMVHQADENNRFPMYYSKDQFFYECRTEKLALEIVYLGTGFRAVQAYRC